MIFFAVLYGTNVGQIGQIAQPDSSAPAMLTAMGAIEVTQAQYEQMGAASYGCTFVGGVVTPSAAPAPTLAQEAGALLLTGLTVASTGTPAINGIYGCADGDQSRFSRMFNLITRAGGNAFPNSLTAVSWPRKSAAPASFTSVATFLAVEQAVGNFVLACDQVMLTGIGPLPAASVTIA